MKATTWIVAAGLACVVSGALAAQAPVAPVQADPDPVATFSILGYDPATGEVGGAVQSRVFSVGTACSGPRRASARRPHRPSWM
jgi:hypothetical protein